MFSKCMKPKIIEKYRFSLAQIREEFAKECDQISLKAKEKMALTSESDISTRQQILLEQQVMLNEALSDLTFTINELNKKLLRDLEQEASRMETKRLNQIDALIDNLK